jgi:hypothetical protein
MANDQVARTFQSEVRRLIRERAPDATVDDLGHAFWWIVFTTKRRRHRGHGSRAWKQRAFRGGHYEPRTP